MQPTKAVRDPLPGESASIEEIAEFWDTHDTTDYEDAFVPADVEFDIGSHHFEVEVREDIFEALRKRSARLRSPVEVILDGLLRKELLTTSS